MAMPRKGTPADRRRRYRERHREELKAKDRKRYQRKKAEILRKAKYDEDGNIKQSYLDGLENWKKRRAESRKQIRLTLITLLGGKCCRCGFDDIRALCIDHINGQGGKERKGRKNLYAYYRAILTRNGEGCQILCANCNAIKRIENKEFRKS
ncbi:MAG: hypothetical protein KGL39_00295 [Patescibacteria group bacterium]|nr:hypothetical protein [Patescibacteria group bacterium]